MVNPFHCLFYCIGDFSVLFNLLFFTCTEFIDYVADCRIGIRELFGILIILMTEEGIRERK